jgi:hypothetical protein
MAFKTERPPEPAGAALAEVRRHPSENKLQATSERRIHQINM